MRRNERMEFDNIIKKDGKTFAILNLNSAFGKCRVLIDINEIDNIINFIDSNEVTKTFLCFCKTKKVTEDGVFFVKGEALIQVCKDTKTRRALVSITSVEDILFSDNCPYWVLYQMRDNIRRMVEYKDFYSNEF